MKRRFVVDTTTVVGNCRCIKTNTRIFHQFFVDIKHIRENIFYIVLMNNNTQMYMHVCLYVCIFVVACMHIVCST